MVKRPIKKTDVVTQKRKHIEQKLEAFKKRLLESEAKLVAARSESESARRGLEEYRKFRESFDAVTSAYEKELGGAGIGLEALTKECASLFAEAKKRLGEKKKTVDQAINDQESKINGRSAEVAKAEKLVESARRELSRAQEKLREVQERENLLRSMPQRVRRDVGILHERMRAVRRESAAKRWGGAYYLATALLKDLEAAKLPGLAKLARDLDQSKLDVEKAREQVREKSDKLKSEERKLQDATTALTMLERTGESALLTKINEPSGAGTARKRG